MRLIDRNDTPLVIGLIAGTAVMFAQPFRFVLSVAEDVSATYHIDLVPGLIVFGLVGCAHFWRKYREAVTRARLTAQSAHETRQRNEGLDRLVAASHAMANATDLSALRAEVRRHLPAVLNGRSAWIATSEPDGWEWMLEPLESEGELLEQAPKLLVSLEAGETNHGRWAFHVLRHGDRAIGIFAVDHETEPTPAESALIGAVVTVVSVAIKNRRLFAELEIRSTTDALTGCYNHTHGITTLGTELKRSRRTRSPLSVLMLDVDGLKAINDKYGHVEGDRLLATFGRMLHRALRTTDIKCRYGGDEFLVILPDTPEHAAHHVADDLRKAVVVELPGSNPITAQASVGVAAVNPGELDPLPVIRRADKALYKNKFERRERPPVLVFGSAKSNEAKAVAAAK